MKILFTHRYFWPDTPPYGALLRSLSTALAERGHEVTVLAGQPSYTRQSAQAPAAETIGKVQVRRLPMRHEDKDRISVRILNVLTYCRRLFREVRRSDADVVVAASFPPVIAAWCASLAARLAGKAFVYHIQDVHPEVAIKSGSLLGRQPFLALLRRMDAQTLRRAALIVLLSRDMARTLDRRADRFNRKKIRIINNFQVESFDNEPAGARLPLKRPDKVRAIFAGNLGRFQNLQLFIDAASLVEHELPHFELMMLGSGVAEAELKMRSAQLSNVHFHDLLPFSQARHVIADADVGLVALASGIVEVSYPSKTFTYFGQGLPLGIVVEPESELAEVVRSHSLGFVAEEQTPEGVARMFRQIASRDGSLDRMAKNARDYFEENGAEERVFNRWDALFRELVNA